MKTRRFLVFAVSFLTLFLGLNAPALAHGGSEGFSGRRGWYGMGPGMMGFGPGMMGMGSGMMGMGPGMMGMMHGMMGMGPGMMGFGPAMMGMGPGMMFGYGPTLTEEQQKQFADIQNRFLKESVSAQTDLIRARAALLLNPSAKEEAIEEQVKKAAAARGRLFILRLRMGREIGKIYTKEQREQMRRGFSSGWGMMGPGSGMMGQGGNPCGAGGRR